MPGKKKPEAPLKEFVAKYTEKRTATKDPGFALRMAFNKKPQKALEDYYVDGDALRAFLSFDNTVISQHVLEETLGKNWTPGTADDYAKWLKEFASFSWPPEQEALYEQPLCPVSDGMKAAYASPKCQLKKVVHYPKGTNPVTSVRMVDLEVTGEGFLTGAVVECINLDTNAVVVAGPVTFKKKSTFRCSVLQTTAMLLPGTYRVRVIDDLGQSGKYTIDRDGDGKIVSFTVQ